MNVPEELRQAADFHTHLGPYLVVGLRMGGVVTREFGETPFAYRIRAHTGKAPPYSCMVDGIQMSTPCTIGNSGVEVGNDRRMAIDVVGEGRTMTITLRTEIFDWIEKECREEDCEEFSCKIWEMEEGRLFTIGESAEGASEG